jgi:hypothetical protein
VIVVRDLGKFGVGYSPRIVVAQDEEWTSSSATSIGTEENSLRVPKAQDEALIYMGVVKHGQHKRVQVQRAASLLSKYEVQERRRPSRSLGAEVSIIESSVRKSEA